MSKIDPDFSLYSRFNPLKNFTTVRFGANAKLLEVEVNEMQDIQNHMRRELIRSIYPNGIFTGTNITYSAGVLTLSEAFVVLDGDIIDIERLSINAPTAGMRIYFRKHYKEITSTDPIKSGGDVTNASEIPNDIYDNRYPIETSRRIQLQFELKTSKEIGVPDTEIMELGYISTPLQEGTGTGTNLIFVLTALKFLPMWMFQGSHYIDGGSFSDNYTRLIDGGYFHEDSQRVLEGGNF